MMRPPAVLGFAVAVAFAVGAGCTGSIGDAGGGGGSGESGDDSGGNGPGGGVVITPPVDEVCDGVPSVAPGRWRRLTSAQYAATVRDLIGMTADTSVLVADARTGPFTTNALFPVQENDVGAYDSLAETLSTKAVANLPPLLGCDSKAMGEDKCATQFIKTFGARAYRRPLVAAEEAAFATVYATGKEESFTAGIRLVVEAMLASPSFLYLIETGTPDDNGLRKLSGYEVATRLSYLLTGTMPDAALFAAARDGELDSADGARGYAQKLLDSDRFVGEVERFHVELLGVDMVTDTTAVTKTPGKYPGFDGAMRTAMLNEPRAFVNYVMNKADGSVAELLTGAYVFPTGPLAQIYGADAQPDEDGRALITDGTRKGLLTLASVLAVHPKLPSPWQAVNRGHVVRQDILCQSIPPPNVKVDFSLPPNAATMTPQELMRQHQDDPTCSGCHVLMDSIGFAFETYDQIGQFRAHDGQGREIATSGEIADLSSDGAFANAGEMAEKLAVSPEVRGCMAQQWFRYALGRSPDDADICSQARVATALSNGRGDIREAVLTLVASDSFRFKQGGE